MEPAHEGVISFCITCKDRLWQLRHTFPANLEAVAEDGRSELVLVNYNSSDGLDEWVSTFQSAVDAGVLRYVHERSEPYFHCSKAKNLAHLAATGTFVVNLDADNYIGDTIPVWRGLWAEHDRTLVHGFCGNYRDGTFGRIGLPRADFMALGGYDEDMLPMSQQDRDLIVRARAFGLRFARVPQTGIPAIPNATAQKMLHCGSSLTHAEMAAANTAHLEENRRAGRVQVNQTRRPTKVVLNHATEIEL